jgi:hypothetical protein
MPTNRQAFFIALTVLIAAAVSLFALHSSVSPLVYKLAVSTEPIGYIMKPEKSAAVGQGHVVLTEIWSYREAYIVRALLRYRRAGDPQFTEMEMNRLGSSVYYAAVLPAQQKGQSFEYYISAQDSEGESVIIPDAAPNGPIPSVTWQSNVNLWTVLFHLVLLIGSAMFGLHAIYYSLLIVFGRQGELAQKATSSRAHSALRWGWLTLAIGGIPLTIYITGVTIGWQNCWTPWPAGASIDDSRTVYLLIYLGAIILLRMDLFRFSPTERRQPWLSNRLFGWLIIAGAGLTLLSYLIPYYLTYR